LHDATSTRLRCNPVSGHDFGALNLDFPTSAKGTMTKFTNGGLRESRWAALLLTFANALKGCTATEPPLTVTELAELAMPLCPMGPSKEA
jgi:hypothetical protein